MNPHDEVSRFYNRLFAFPKHFDEALADRLDEILKQRGGQSVLDMGCGAGNPSIGLALAGYEVTAIDTSAGMLELARNNAQELRASIDFLECPMEEAEILGRRFDLVICHDSLYHFDTPDKLARFCHETKKSLVVPGGCLYIATKRWDRLAGREDRQCFELRGSVPCGDRRNLVVFDVCESNMLTVFLIEEEYGQARSTSIRFPWHPRDPLEIQDALRKVGFGNVRQANEEEEAKYNCVGLLAC